MFFLTRIIHFTAHINGETIHRNEKPFVFYQVLNLFLNVKRPEA